MNEEEKEEQSVLSTPADPGACIGLAIFFLAALMLLIYSVLRVLIQGS